MTRTALVVGGSGGIGSAIVRRLASDGLIVIVGYGSNSDTASELVSGLAGEGHRPWPVSVNDAGSLKALADHLSSEFGHLDVLVNCAGVTRPVPHHDLIGLDDNLIDEIFRVNWRGPFATIRALQPLLAQSVDPVIVNISSIAGSTGQGSNVAYCASKAALDSMTRSLARSLAPTIRTISVSPGWAQGAYADQMPPEMIDRQRRETPQGRLATPDDVADAVSAVVASLRFTNGAVIPVDGGRPLGTA